MRHRLLIKKTLCLLIFLLLCQTCVYATENSTGIIDRLEDAKAEFSELTQKLKPESFLSLITANLLEYTRKTSAYFGCAIAVILVSMIFSSISEGSGSQRIFDMVSDCCIILCVFPAVIMCFMKSQEHIEAICGFMLSFIPVGTALHAASGNTLSSSLLSAMGTGTVSVLQIICANLILPLIKANCSVIAANILCRKVNLSGISTLLKSVSLWITGLYFTLFTGIISLSTTLQASADNLAMKGIKYGAAKLIPIAGGLVSESMKTVIASASFIKSTTGAAGIVFILYTLIPPLCLILIIKLEMSILSAFSKAISSEKAATFLDSLGSCMNILLALLISCSLAFIIMLSVFMKTNVTI